MVWVAFTVTFLSIPKVYVHEWLGHNHEQTPLNLQSEQLSNQANSDCRFEEFDTPVSFDFVAFNHSVAELYKHVKVSYLPETDFVYAKTDTHHITLRGPPAA